VVAETDILGFFALKFGLLMLLVVVSAKGAIDRDRISYYAPPLFAIFIGTFLTVWNLVSVGLV
jgi:hypothetical protein